MFAYVKSGNDMKDLAKKQCIPCRGGVPTLTDDALCEYLDQLLTFAYIESGDDVENLTKKQCTPCQGGVTKLTGDALREYFDQLQGWELVQEHHVSKKYKFENFKRALVFADLVGDLAERENHHPSICISWGEARIELFTHKIDGLHENDFIMASKIDEISQNISDK